ncbi:phosphoribosylamine--glycine ligase [Vallitalea sp.]|jgi:phosphoribosylamine--glycine ligase|uniref:phosphoribosylamine--glycine ligase n=1 Tax=Vallitalea sp. TaxID=1882829 RepID=UPI0025DADECA|nr:phosphoribosylamine--glycine ligase [Vallitalea sp.]MCT4687794.1 phosphoribosylamine--glycine ligase [Vallitalea sp.]
MNILVIGSGGREHAIIWKLSQSKRVDKIYCAPGNAGISELAECVDIPATDIKGLLDFALSNPVDLTVVGMDDPLMLGVVDAFENKGLKIFGPKQNAAIIEGSKIFSKDLMKKYNIPTAGYVVIDNVDSANDYIKKCDYPIVIKADGLALGKGVLICSTYKEAQEAVDTIMVDKKFGDAGDKIVIEEFLTGPEVSVLSFCDGENIIPMVSAQDHKRAFDGDEGLNTGGMGTFSPSKYYTDEIHKECVETIYKPSLKAMKNEGRPFTGIMFFGLMLTEKGPKLLEYNARFGDPEAQVVLPRLQTDLLDIFEYAIEGKLNEIDVKWDDRAAVCVILASGGYPVKYEKGYEIKGLQAQKDKDDVIVFHSGTKKVDDKIITNGGRVLGLTAIGRDIDEARDIAYKTVEEVDFTNKHFRKDIGIK